MENTTLPDKRMATIRMPSDLYDDLKSAAEAAGKSLNQFCLDQFCLDALAARIGRELDSEQV